MTTAVECSHCRRDDHERCLGYALPCECDENGHPDHDREGDLL